MSIVGYKTGDFGKKVKSNGKGFDGNGTAMKTAINKANNGKDAFELLEKKYMNLMFDKKKGISKEEIRDRSTRIFTQAQRAADEGKISENPYTIGVNGEIKIVAKEEIGIREYGGVTRGGSFSSGIFM